HRGGDALHVPHRCSMTYSMIISNGVDIAAGSPSRRTGEQRRQRSRQLSDGARPRGWASCKTRQIRDRLLLGWAEFERSSLAAMRLNTPIVARSGLGRVFAADE